jgi:glucokinase
MNYLLGMDLGGSSVKAVAVTRAGEALARHLESFTPEQPGQFIETVRATAQRLSAQLGAAPERIGLSAPGLASPDGRSIAYMPGRLARLEGLDWTEQLAAAHPVPVLNDAHAALLGEVWRGAAQGARHAILLTLGTGVGGAALVDGRLLRGAIGRAGHLGHISLDPAGPPDICGTPGSLELAIGNATIGPRTQGRFATTHDLIRACEASDAFAREVWLKSVRALAAAVASLINVLDPEVVIVGGGIARAGAALFEPLTRFLDDMEWRPGGHRARLAAAQLGEFAGAWGAAYRTFHET